ncbi:MAG: hypothetical protein PHD37_00900 [Gallionellaceae bacterium]|nr:hypothetical protein [Gallionellaceae bacterium]
MNALYQITSEYRRNHPTATPSDLWTHLVRIAALGSHPVLLGYTAGAIEYAPDPEKVGTRTIKRASFIRKLRGERLESIAG